jgi:hypothetical protein
MLKPIASTQANLTTLEANMTTIENKAADEQTQERHAANAKVSGILQQFVKAVHLIRPTSKAHGIGPQLELVALRAIHDMAAYFHDHMRDHYDARKDV